MNVVAVRTQKVTTKDTDLKTLLDMYVPEIKERSVIAVTSKIVALCEGRVAAIEGVDKKKLIENESEYFLPSEENQYGVSITIKNNIVIASAGIDESNADGKYVLWPVNPQESANRIREYLAKSRGLREIGVIITDSRLSPLRWGVTGVGIAHSGFEAVNDMRGKPDIFGRPLHVTKVNILDGLAAASVYVMGESNEQTPLALVTEIPHIRFQDHNPSEDELTMLKITMEEDIFSGILKNVTWRRGKK